MQVLLVGLSVVLSFVVCSCQDDARFYRTADAVTSMAACVSADLALNEVPILKAVAFDERAGVEDMLDEGADVNREFHFQFGDERLIRTPLSCAVESNHVDMARLLLDSGADASGIDTSAITNVPLRTLIESRR